MKTTSSLAAENSRCDRKRSRHDCTKYQATLRYEVQGAQYRIVVSAESVADTINRSRTPITPGARARSWDYDPRRPSRAYRDKLWDIWGAPLVTFFVRIGTFVARFTESQKKKKGYL